MIMKKMIFAFATVLGMTVASCTGGNAEATTEAAPVDSTEVVEETVEQADTAVVEESVKATEEVAE